MAEGTRSYLFGCHHWLLHPLFVILSWRRHHEFWPHPWQIVCIFLHDVGLVGRQYISGSKDGHWRRGALIAERLFGAKGYFLCAGHTSESGYGRSGMFLPDKLSWLLQPDWLLWLYVWAEGGELTPPREWKASVAERAKNGFEVENHEAFLQMREERRGRSR